MTYGLEGKDSKDNTCFGCTKSRESFIIVSTLRVQNLCTGARTKTVYVIKATNPTSLTIQLRLKGMEERKVEIKFLLEIVYYKKSKM